jgi:hypothetical protein
MSGQTVSVEMQQLAARWRFHDTSQRNDGYYGEARVYGQCAFQLEALIARVKELEATRPPSQEVPACPDHICATCYHPLDRCSHCDAEATRTQSPQQEPEQEKSREI